MSAPLSYLFYTPQRHLDEVIAKRSQLNKLIIYSNSTSAILFDLDPAEPRAIRQPNNYYLAGADVYVGSLFTNRKLLLNQVGTLVYDAESGLYRTYSELDYREMVEIG